MDTETTTQAESAHQREARHQAHQWRLHEQHEAKMAAREKHKRDHGKKRPYPGHY